MATLRPSPAGWRLPVQALVPEMRRADPENSVSQVSLSESVTL